MSFVRSKLEYASFIWNPYYAVHSNRLERIQKVFLKFALQSLNFVEPIPSYNARCLLINLKSLHSRRITLSLLFVYDVICGNIDCSHLLEFICFNAPIRSLRNFNMFNIPFHRANYVINEPLNRALIEFNKVSLHHNIDFSISKDLFKNLLNCIYF